MSSFPTSSGMPIASTLLETSCGYLLQELQMIWDEVGEDEFEREKLLLDLEHECLDVYRRKVDIANISRSRLHQQLAEDEAEFTHLLLSLGEPSLPGRPEKMVGSLKEQLESITPALREMRLRKEERLKQFRAVQGQIQKISAEISGDLQFDDSSSIVVVLNESDLSLKKLEEYQVELQRLQNKKIDHINKVHYYIDTVVRLSATLGMDSSSIIKKVHPSLNDGSSKNSSNYIIAKLSNTVESLEEEKIKRLEKFHQLGRALANLWDLMDTSDEDRLSFAHVICLLPLSSSEVSSPGLLASNIIQQADAEVRRLDQLKASRMKELFFRKQNELEAICNKSHIEIPSQSEMQSIIHLINSGEIDHANLLLSMDEHISRAKEEACSRKSIMEKVEKWMQARDEERWLEEYNMDQNRYSVSRGAHKNLRRAERARLTVNKIPALVDLLVVKTKSWEKERDQVFLYDEVPLLEMLAEYNALRQEKDEEKRRIREKKKVQVQVVMEPENYSGSGASTSNRGLSNMIPDASFGNALPSIRGRSLVGIQRLGCNVLKSPAQATSFIKNEKMIRTLGSHLRDETASVVSTFSGPLSP